MKSNLLAFLSFLFSAASAGAASTGREDAWSLSDAVVTAKVVRLDQVRELPGAREQVGEPFFLYRAVIHASSIDGRRLKAPKSVTVHFSGPSQDSTMDQCPPFVRLRPATRIKAGMMLRTVQPLGRVLWIPSGDYVKTYGKGA